MLCSARIYPKWSALKAQGQEGVGPGDGEFLRRRAAELVALAPDAIVVNGTSPITPLLQATRQVPIVFVNVSDPVGAGFVASLLNRAAINDWICSE
jgi:ABC-type uncharacterized transport system substrate-binding protein